MDNIFEIQNKINEAYSKIYEYESNIEESRQTLSDFKKSIISGFSIVLVMGSLIIFPLTINDLISIKTTLISMGFVLTFDVVGFSLFIVAYPKYRNKLKHDISNNERLILEKQKEVLELQKLLNDNKVLKRSL